MIRPILILITFSLAVAFRTVLSESYFDYYGEGYSHLQSDMAWSRFDLFKAKHHITYPTANEERVAFEKYKVNLAKVEQHNKRFQAGQETYEMYADYPWAAMTEKEFQMRWTGHDAEGALRFRLNNGNVRMRHPSYRQLSSIPEEKDWRKESNCINPVKTQACSNSYAYAASCALEAAVCIQLHGGKVATRNISEQRCTDCAGNYYCSGGWAFQCFNYVSHREICDAVEDYPNVGGYRPCPADARTMPPVCRSSGYVQVENTLPALLEAVANVGPVAVSVWADSKFRQYKKGTDGSIRIFQDSCDFEVANHDVIVVGYTKDALIIRNSWGTDWGYDGYMYMEREVTARNRGMFSDLITFPIVY